MLRFLGIFVCALLCMNIAHAQNAPRVYTDSSGNNQLVRIATTLGDDGSPMVKAYQDTAGNYQAPLVISVVCSVDNDGFPQLCPQGLTQQEASTLFMSVNGGTLDGSITGKQGVGISLPDGTLHAGYVVADATVNATAFGTGYGGWYDLTSPTGAYNMKIRLDSVGNLNITSQQSGAGGIVIGYSTFANLPTTEPSDGVLYYCSDCTYNGVQGVLVRWSSANSGWYTSDNVKVSSQTTSAAFNTAITGIDASFSGNVVAGKSLQIQVPNSTVTGGILPIGTLGLELINSNSAIMDLRAGSIYSSWLIVPKTFTYANLPSSPPAGGNAWCSDCWSSSNSNGSSNKGIPVWWSGSSWVDALGQAVNHN